MKRTLCTLLLAALLPAATAGAPGPEPPGARLHPAATIPARQPAAPQPNRTVQMQSESTRNGPDATSSGAVRTALSPTDTLQADWRTGQVAGIAQPSFEGGGFDDFRRWVEERAPKNPAVLCSTPTGGRAVFSFVIDTLGRLTDIRVLQSPDRSLTEGAARVLKSSPRWKPGSRDGRKVAVRYTLPVDFRQQN